MMVSGSMTKLMDMVSINTLMEHYTKVNGKKIYNTGKDMRNG